MVKGNVSLFCVTVKYDKWLTRFSLSLFSGGHLSFNNPIYKHKTAERAQRILTCQNDVGTAVPSTLNKTALTLLESSISSKVRFCVSAILNIF